MKPSIPQGTRDFGPKEMARRNYIFSTLKNVFQLHGYEQIETPSMENFDTLMGKYGEEGDRLIFKILNSGDFLLKANKEALDESNSQKLTRSICEKALRYDLTVPFARYVVQNQHLLSFPFKRFQIQPVWRADRPQAGRYREFYQCDVDVIGSNSLLNEVELISIMSQGFTALGLPDVTIRINNRKILAGIAAAVGAPDHMMTITIAIDKIDKVGIEGVNKELAERGISSESIEKLQPLLVFKGNTAEKINYLETLFSDVEIGLKGIEETRFALDKAAVFGIENIELDLTLARGLNYYTGAIFEVGHPDFPSSICGGGRYDDLTGIFGLPNLSGVGVSFGADRIYDLLLKKDLFPAEIEAGKTILFANFGEAEAFKSLQLANQLRAAGIASEVYPDAAKMKKQFKYADDKKVRFMCIIGESELQNGLVQVKDFSTGNQEPVAENELSAYLTAKLF